MPARRLSNGRATAGSWYLFKPIDIEEFFRTVENLMRGENAEANQAKAKKAAQAKAGKEQPSAAKKAESKAAPQPSHRARLRWGRGRLRVQARPATMWSCPNGCSRRAVKRARRRRRRRSLCLWRDRSARGGSFGRTGIGGSTETRLYGALQRHRGGREPDFGVHLRSHARERAGPRACDRERDEEPHHHSHEFRHRLPHR